MTNCIWLVILCRWAFMLSCARQRYSAREVFRRSGFQTLRAMFLLIPWAAKSCNAVHFVVLFCLTTDGFHWQGVAKNCIKGLNIDNLTNIFSHALWTCFALTHYPVTLLCPVCTGKSVSSFNKSTKQDKIYFVDGLIFPCSLSTQSSCTLNGRLAL
jgi:hypothetical protein